MESHIQVLTNVTHHDVSSLLPFTNRHPINATPSNSICTQIKSVELPSPLSGSSVESADDNSGWILSPDCTCRIGSLPPKETMIMHASPHRLSPSFPSSITGFSQDHDGDDTVLLLDRHRESNHHHNNNLHNHHNDDVSPISPQSHRCEGNDMRTLEDEEADISINGSLAMRTSPDPPYFPCCRLVNFSVESDQDDDDDDDDDENIVDHRHQEDEAVARVVAATGLLLQKVEDGIHHDVEKLQEDIDQNRKDDSEEENLQGEDQQDVNNNNNSNDDDDDEELDYIPFDYDEEVEECLEYLSAATLSPSQSHDEFHPGEGAAYGAAASCLEWDASHDESAILEEDHHANHTTMTNNPHLHNNNNNSNNNHYAYRSPPLLPCGRPTHQDTLLSPPPLQPSVLGFSPSLTNDHHYRMMISMQQNQQFHQQAKRGWIERMDRQMRQSADQWLRHRQCFCREVECYVRLVMTQRVKSLESTPYYFYRAPASASDGGRLSSSLLRRSEMMDLSALPRMPVFPSTTADHDEEDDGAPPAATSPSSRQEQLRVSHMERLLQLAHAELAKLADIVRTHRQQWQGVSLKPSEWTARPELETPMNRLSELYTLLLVPCSPCCIRPVPFAGASSALEDETPRAPQHCPMLQRRRRRVVVDELDDEADEAEVSEGVLVDADLFPCGAVLDGTPKRRTLHHSSIEEDAPVEEEEDDEDSLLSTYYRDRRSTSSSSACMTGPSTTAHHNDWTNSLSSYRYGGASLPTVWEEIGAELDRESSTFTHQYDDDLEREREAIEIEREAAAHREIQLHLSLSTAVEERCGRQRRVLARLQRQWVIHRDLFLSAPATRTATRTTRASALVPMVELKKHYFYSNENEDEEKIEKEEENEEPKGLEGLVVRGSDARPTTTTSATGTTGTNGMDGFLSIAPDTWSPVGTRGAALSTLTTPPMATLALERFPLFVRSSPLPSPPMTPKPSMKTATTGLLVSLSPLQRPIQSSSSSGSGGGAGVLNSPGAVAALLSPQPQRRSSIGGGSSSLPSPSSSSSSARLCTALLRSPEGPKSPSAVSPSSSSGSDEMCLSSSSVSLDEGEWSGAEWLRFWVELQPGMTHPTLFLSSTSEEDKNQYDDDANVHHHHQHKNNNAERDRDAVEPSPPPPQQQDDEEEEEEEERIVGYPPTVTGCGTITRIIASEGKAPAVPVDGNTLAHAPPPFTLSQRQSWLATAVASTTTITTTTTTTTPSPSSSSMALLFPLL